MGTSVLTECAEDFRCPAVLNESSFSYLVQSDSTVTYFSLALMFLSWSFFNMLSFSQAKVENRKKLSCSLSLLLHVLPGTWSVLTFASRRSLALQFCLLFFTQPQAALMVLLFSCSLVLCAVTLMASHLHTLMLNRGFSPEVIGITVNVDPSFPYLLLTLVM